MPRANEKPLRMKLFMQAQPSMSNGETRGVFRHLHAVAEDENRTLESALIPLNEDAIEALFRSISEKLNKSSAISDDTEVQVN